MLILLAIASGALERVAALLDRRNEPDAAEAVRLAKGIVDDVLAGLD